MIQGSWLGRARLCVLAAFTYAFFFSGGGPNQATRMALTESLVVRHQPDITPYHARTIAFPFSTLLFGHQLSTLCILSAFVITLERRQKGTLVRPTTLLALGAIWTLSIVVEYPTALLVAVFGTATLVWTLDRSRPVRSVVRTLLWAGAGGLPLLVVHAAFLVWCYGKFALPYVYVSEPYFRAHMSGGILGLGVPTMLATYGSLLSPYRGLLFYCPVVALAVAGLGSWIDSAKDRATMPVVLAALGIYLLFGCSYYAWDGGGSVGPRHLLPIVPLLLLLVAFFADRSRWTFGVTLVVAMVSSALMIAVTTVHVQLPLGDAYHANPFYDVVVRSILEGKGAINSQDAYVPYPRADGAFNLGMILGLGPLAALFIIPAVWVAAYMPSIVSWVRRPAHA